MSGSGKDKKINVFHYARKMSSVGILSHNLVALTDTHIDKIGVDVVKKMLRDIRLQITNFETSGYVPDSFLKKLTIVGDVVFTFVDIGKWRHGSAYLLLQLSNKEEGVARLSVYTTDTIFHSSWGTTPDIEQAEKMIADYLGKNKGKDLRDDLELLKKLHSTKKSVTDLILSIQINA